MKKQLLKSMLVAVAGVGLLAGSALATPVLPGNETPLNTVFTNQGWNIDANLDQLSYDSYWKIAEKQSGSFSTLIIEIAGHASTNTFGIFDQSNNYLELLSGPSVAGEKISMSFDIITGKLTAVNMTTKTFIATDIDFGQTFGYYLGYGSVGDKFYSDATKNPGGADQMTAYMGTGTGINGNGLSVGHYILAFEDILYRSSDKDFNDMVVMVESVEPTNPVPEPTTMLLFGTGLMGLAAVARRRKNS